MSKDTKRKAVTLTSPRGVFKYPALNKPDYGTKDHPKAEGEYKVALLLTQEQADEWREGPLKAVIEQARKEAEAEFSKLPIATRKKLKELTWNEVGTDEYDKTTEEPTGMVEFRCKMKASGTRKDGTAWKQVPALFDSRGKALGTKAPDIWGGSEGKVSIEASPYFIPGSGAAGVSLRLKAVQVIKLVQGGHRDAAGYGFGAEDDGFDADEFQAEDTEDTTDTQAAAEGDGTGDF